MFMYSRCCFFCRLFLFRLIWCGNMLFLQLMMNMYGNFRFLEVCRVIMCIWLLFLFLLLCESSVSWLVRLVVVVLCGLFLNYCVSFLMLFVWCWQLVFFLVCWCSLFSNFDFLVILWIMLLDVIWCICVCRLCRMLVNCVRLLVVCGGSCCRVLMVLVICVIGMFFFCVSLVSLVSVLVFILCLGDCIVCMNVVLLFGFISRCSQVSVFFIFWCFRNMVLLVRWQGMCSSCIVFFSGCDWKLSWNRMQKLFYGMLCDCVMKVILVVIFFVLCLLLWYFYIWMCLLLVWLFYSFFRCLCGLLVISVLVVCSMWLEQWQFCFSLMIFSVG